MSTVEFVRARLDDDDDEGPWVPESIRNALRAVINLHYFPAQHGYPAWPTCPTCVDSPGDHADFERVPCPTLRVVASIWRSHPDWLEEWEAPVTPETTWRAT